MTEVVEEKGRWSVYMEVLFVDGAVRHQIGTYHTRQRAEMAAGIVYRSANRESGSGWEGS